MTAVAQNAIHQMPPGSQSPYMIVYSASSVPILQLALSGQGLSEQQLFDYAANYIRTQLATVKGAAILRPVHESDHPRSTAAYGCGAGRTFDGSGIQHNPREAVESGTKYVRLASACSAVDMSFGVDVERGDTAFVVGDRRSHAWQTGGKSDHRALADKLVREFIEISLDLRRIRIESGFRLHRGNP